MSSLRLARHHTIGLQLVGLRIKTMARRPKLVGSLHASLHAQVAFQNHDFEWVDPF
jgi:hypothetical protein